MFFTQVEPIIGIIAYCETSLRPPSFVRRPTRRVPIPHLNFILFHTVRYCLTVRNRFNNVSDRTVRFLEQRPEVYKHFIGLKDGRIISVVVS